MSEATESLDYDRLIEVIANMEALAIIGTSAEDQMKSIINPDDLMRVATTRCAAVIAHIEADPGLLRAFTVTFMQAFIAGAEYQRKGGHRDGGGAAASAGD